jgi:hypothetical protein
MELKRTDKKPPSATLGAVGLAAIAAACGVCCLPLLAPLLAGLGLAGLSAAAAGWYLAAAGLLAVGVAMIVAVRRRRAASCHTRPVSDCDCASHCRRREIKGVKWRPD